MIRDGILQEGKADLPAIRQWIDNRMPDIVRDLTRICGSGVWRRRKLPNTRPLEKDAGMFWKKCFTSGRKTVFGPKL